MKAIAVAPGRKDSVHLAELSLPSLDEITDGRGVPLRLLWCGCGVDGTHKKINAAQYGTAPDGASFLVIGHENFGRVQAVSPNVHELSPGDYVVAHDPTAWLQHLRPDR
jgi:threonine dehydrogenase-like Zn-dependent dehydrogenase